MKTKNVNDWHFVEHLSTDIKTMAGEASSQPTSQPSIHWVQSVQQRKWQAIEWKWLRRREEKKITNKPTDAKIDYKCTNDINMQKFTVKQR